MNKLFLCATILFVVSTATAMAQVCTGMSVVTPQSPLNNKVPGPPSPSSTVAIRYTFGGDATNDCDSDVGNGGAALSVDQVTIRPSCNFVGGECVNDPGGSDGDPTTPAVEFFLLDNTDCAGGLANITVDSTDPFSVKLNFAVTLIFPPNTNCSVDVTLHVREIGDATTRSTIAQQYETVETCLCSPEMSLIAVTSSQLFLTCPPCNTNFCTPEHCEPTPIPRCVAGPAPDCSKPDDDPCTPGFCDPAAKNGNGACVSGPRNPPPSEIQNVTVAADKATYSWTAANDATQYDVVRGSTGLFPVGAGGDEVCFDIVAETSVSDPATPAPHNGFWYLFRGENSCGIGTWGDQSDGLPRVTKTCP